MISTISSKGLDENQARDEKMHLRARGPHEALKRKEGRRQWKKQKQTREKMEGGKGKEIGQTEEVESD